MKISGIAKLMGIALIGVGLGGCATGIARGTVAMKINDSEAHVALNRGEVKIGDHVELFANECKPKGKEREACKKVSRGHGDVVEILNEHYSLVKFESGVAFEEGNFIEKHAH